MMKSKKDKHKDAKSEGGDCEKRKRGRELDVGTKEKEASLIEKEVSLA